MVQFTDSPAATDDEAWDFITGSGAPTLSFSKEEPAGSGDYISKPLGTKFTGYLKGSPIKKQATDYSTGEPKFYDDGNPIYDLVLTLDTDYRDPAKEDDDGVRRLFVGGGMRKALAAEMREKKLKRFGDGTQVTVELSGFKPNPKGKPSKVFTVTIGDVKEYVPPTDPIVAEMTREEPAAKQVAKATPDQIAAAMKLLGAKEVITIDPSLVAKVETLISAGIDRAAAIAAVATTSGREDEEFRAALDESVPF